MLSKDSGNKNPKSFIMNGFIFSLCHSTNMLVEKLIVVILNDATVVSESATSS